MIVVGDTSALILLTRINKLDFLDKLYSKVYIPKTVFEEALAKDSEDAYLLESYLETKIWNKDIVEKISNPKYPRNQGEYDCINLCFTIEMDETIQDDFQILIDDREGKKLAEKKDIPCIGTITLLRKAIHKGIWKDYNDIQEAIATIENSVNNRDGLRVPMGLLKENLNEAIIDKNIKQVQVIPYTHTRSLV